MSLARGPSPKACRKRLSRGAWRVIQHQLTISPRGPPSRAIVSTFSWGDLLFLRQVLIHGHQ